MLARDTLWMAIAIYGLKQPFQEKKMVQWRKSLFSRFESTCLQELLVWYNLNHVFKNKGRNRIFALSLHYFDESIVELSIECKHKCNICNKSFACIQHIFYRIVHEWLIQTCWRHFSDGATTIKGGHMIYPQSFKVSLMHTNFSCKVSKEPRLSLRPHVLNFFQQRHREPAFFAKNVKRLGTLGILMSRIYIFTYISSFISYFLKRSEGTSVEELLNKVARACLAN